MRAEVRIASVVRGEPKTERPCFPTGSSASCTPSTPGPTGARVMADYWIDARGHLRTSAFEVSTGNRALRIKGASWFGLESASCYIGGADSDSLHTFADFLANNGFNAVRVPLALSELLPDAIGTCLNPSAYQVHNANFGRGVSDYLAQLDHFIRLLGKHGLLVLLDVHVRSPGAWPDDGKLADDDASHLQAAWLRLAERFCDSAAYWNVMGADLKNEPHGMYWGPPPPDAPQNLYPPDQRWDTHASRIGSALHQRCPRWLLFAEGVDHCKGESDTYGCAASNWVPRSSKCGPCTFYSAANQSAEDTVPSSFWGENMQGVYHYPLRVHDANGRDVSQAKVVLSPHTYGPSVHYQNMFHEHNFPSNMPAIWDAQYGALASAPHRRAIVVGEWGGRMGGNPLEATWQHAFRDYLRERAIGSFYWALNPESADTGGLLLSWAPLVPDQSKLDLLAPLVATPVPRAAERTSFYTPPPITPPPPVPPPSPPPSPPAPPPAPPPVPSSPPPPPDPPWRTGYGRSHLLGGLVRLPPPSPPILPPGTGEFSSFSVPMGAIAAGAVCLLLIAIPAAAVYLQRLDGRATASAIPTPAAPRSKRAGGAKRAAKPRRKGFQRGRTDDGEGSDGNADVEEEKVVGVDLDLD